jgi:chromosome partition protein MukF
MSPPSAHISIEEAVTSAYQSGFNLTLDPEKMAFLVGIYVFSKYKQTETSLSTGDLKTVFSRVNTLIFGDEETLDRRANNAITHLREQGLLSKMDGVGGNQYVLSSLGKAIGQFWENAEVLTRQSLVLYTSHLRLVLNAIRADAEVGGDDSYWGSKVTLPLKEIISDIIDSIDRRQRGMSSEQQRIEKEISQKLTAGWMEAIEACEAMLKTTGEALDELHTILLQEADSILNVLDEIGELALTNEKKDSMEAVELVQAQLETIRQWSNHSHEEWSKYYQNVHNFIRMRVRTDPNRDFSHRLHEAIKVYYDTPWRFSIPKPEPYVSIREGEFSRPAVLKDVTGQINHPDIEESIPFDQSLLESLEAEIAHQIESQGSASLVSILQKLAPKLTILELYRVAGELVSLMVERGRPNPPVNHFWSRVVGAVEVQDLTVCATTHPTEDAHD